MPDGREDISTKPHQPVAFMLGRADGGAPIPADMRVIANRRLPVNGAPER